MIFFWPTVLHFAQPNIVFLFLLFFLSTFLETFCFVRQKKKLLMNHCDEHLNNQISLYSHRSFPRPHCPFKLRADIRADIGEITNISVPLSVPRREFPRITTKLSRMKGLEHQFCTAELVG